MREHPLRGIPRKKKKKTYHKWLMEKLARKQKPVRRRYGITRGSVSEGRK